MFANLWKILIGTSTKERNQENGQSENTMYQDGVQRSHYKQRSSCLRSKPRHSRIVLNTFQSPLLKTSAVPLFCPPLSSVEPQWQSWRIQKRDPEYCKTINCWCQFGFQKVWQSNVSAIVFSHLKVLFQW